MNLHTNPPSRSLYERKHHFRMKNPPPLLATFFASFFLVGAPAGAQSPAAPPKQAKTENAADCGTLQASPACHRLLDRKEWSWLGQWSRGQ